MTGCLKLYLLVCTGDDSCIALQQHLSGNACIWRTSLLGCEGHHDFPMCIYACAKAQAQSVLRTTLSLTCVCGPPVTTVRAQWDDQTAVTHCEQKGECVTVGPQSLSCQCSDIPPQDYPGGPINQTCLTIAQNNLCNNWKSPPPDDYGATEGGKL